MSGIFGFSYDFTDNAKTLHALEVWNRDYGNAVFDSQCDDIHGIGAHIEHFSDNIKLLSPILYKDNKEAVFDTLIYNRDELLEELGIAEKQTISDEELLFKFIDSKDFEKLSYVNGDFAGAVYDINEKKWILFRDHLGVRPLYYYTDNDRFAFSTDIRALLSLPNADTSLDENSIYCRMMGYNDLTLCDTDYKNIKCIPPASWVEICQNKEAFCVKAHTYWKLKQKKIKFKTDEEYFEETRRIVTDAVKRRLCAISGTIGAELSGGLDSGVIDILISRLGRAGKFFSWSWSTNDIPMNDGDDERKIINDICKQENITCEFTPKKQTSSEIKETSEILPPFINTLNLSEGSAHLKSQGAKVVFTGHGGDEGISHRCSQFELLYNGELSWYLKYYWNSTKGKNLRLLRTLKRSVCNGYRDFKAFTTPYHNIGLISSRYLSDSFKEKMKTKAELQPLYFSYAPEKYIMQGGTRIRLDNVAFQGAKNGIRYMIPFADYRVMDFAVSIPRHMFLKYGENRYVYREAFRGIMPNSLYRVKYKDTASLRGYPMDSSLREYFDNSVKRLQNKLDREFWKEYLNFDAIDNISLPENFTKDDYIRASRSLHQLERCLLIQNARDNAAKWCEEHE